MLVLAYIIPHLGFAAMTLISTPSPVSTDKPETPTSEELRTWACCIRDVVLPRIRTGEESSLSPGILDEIQEFLSLLKQAHINVETLRYTRVHTALEEIVAVGSKLPETVIGRAGEMLSLWEEDFGRLTDIQVDLFGPGGRLAGVVRLKDLRKALDSRVASKEAPEVITVLKSKDWAIGCNVEGGNGPFYSFREGHNGFKVGE